MPRFSPGMLAITPGCLEAFRRSGDDPLSFIRRHLEGDWGDLDPVDVTENELSLIRGYRLLSAYHLADNTKIWCITEADRSATTLLLPEEY